MRWYSLEGIESRKCDYNFIVSGRGPGKSTAMVNYLIDRFHEGENFVRICRYDWEVSNSIMTQWFNSVNVDHLHEYFSEDCFVSFSRGRFYLEDGEGRRVTMGFVVTLNNQDVFKSASYDGVTNIVVEEFAMMDERSYIKGEIELFLSALSTIVRNRQNVRVWLIGNTLTKHNPYFDFFGIDVDRLGIVPGTIRTFRCAGFGGLGATVALEYADMSHEDISEISPLMRVGGNVTATSGLYAVQPSVAEFEERTSTLLDDDYVRLLQGIDGLYLGGGLFCDARITRRPRFDDMRLVVMRLVEPTALELLRHRYLNLSGVANPRFEFDGTTYDLRTVSPIPIWSDRPRMLRLQRRDAMCVHAFETDEIRYKWRNFVDCYGFEPGEV